MKLGHDSYIHILESKLSESQNKLRVERSRNNRNEKYMLKKGSQEKKRQADDSASNATKKARMALAESKKDAKQAEKAAKVKGKAKNTKGSRAQPKKANAKVNVMKKQNTEVEQMEMAGVSEHPDPVCTICFRIHTSHLTCEQYLNCLTILLSKRLVRFGRHLQ